MTPLHPPEVSQIAERLWQADAHPLAVGAYDHVVSLDASSARLYPPPDGVTETLVALSDTTMERHDEVAAVIGDTHRRWQDGQRVVVRCAYGMSRSGLVVAGVLMCTGLTADEAIVEVRARRHPDAVDNPYYQAWLASWTPDGPPPERPT